MLRGFKLGTCRLRFVVIATRWISSPVSRPKASYCGHGTPEHSRNDVHKKVFSRIVLRSPRAILMISDRGKTVG